jgi:ribosomal protein S12 methylthiotransferase
MTARFVRHGTQEPVLVAFVALGCPKNTVDSERMLAEIAQAGCLITTEPEQADVIVINTCGFIAPAKKEALEEIERAVALKHSGRAEKVIVAGCLPQRLGKKLFDEAKGIDAIVGLDHRDEIAGIIQRTLAGQGPRAYLGRPQPPAAAGPTANIRPGICDDRVRLRITPGHWAYLRISEGCDHRCSFCTIPAIRGPFRSKPRELIVAEATELVTTGALELNIIAQDTTYYGRDRKEKDALVKLLAELEKIPALTWVRLLYCYPANIDDRLIEAIAESRKVVHYLDLPIQHISDAILKRMRRPDRKERIRRLIERLRRAIPDIVLRTTVIIGFPGEKDSHFQELLEFVRWARFDALGCFPYYRESGTAAAEMHAQVPEDTKHQRLDELMLTQQQIAFAKNQERIDTCLTCLVDSVDEQGNTRSRYYGQAPEIDSLCIIKNCSAKPGDFIDAKVVGTP